MKNKNIIVIGAGFAGLSAACYAAKNGAKVTLIEKNEQTGGRASQFKAEGFTFDMGPSWYWMPDVFESFFSDFGKKVSDYYELEQLDPGYRVFFGKNDIVDIPAKFKELQNLFESLEKGAAETLKEFLDDAAYKYKRGIYDLVNKPSVSILEFTSPLLIKDLFTLDLLSSIEKLVHKKFQNEKIRKILEFPAYFLGATPDNIPALYSLMNYADLVLGTWYPKGGMHKIIAGMTSLAEELGVKIVCNESIEKIEIEDSKAKKVVTANKVYEADAVISAADYHHVEQNLIEKKYRKYDESYWNKQTLAPSSLIFYLGIDKEITGLQHHNLFFDEDFTSFGEDIYKNPKWPDKPLFYVCCPSKTDETVAPKGKENIFILMPVAPDLDNTTAIEDKYYDLLLTKLEQYTNTEIKQHVCYKRAFAQKEFKQRYNSYKGNAYGLANTLNQTALLKPKMYNSKIKNLVFTGQLTVPGPGVPPSLISGKISVGLLQDKI